MADIYIVDATNLERNLYLTTQLTELGIPVVIALNMMDLVRKAGDSINVKELSRQLGCQIVEISALKGDGVKEAALAAIEAAKNGKTIPQHRFSGPVEHALAHIEEVTVHNLPEEQQRWYAIKVFERDEKVLESLNLTEEVKAHIEKDIEAAEKELDDDAESIITNERYVYIAQMLKGIYKKKGKGQLSVSDKIDKIVTNRILALPIFVLVMWLVYALSMGSRECFLQKHREAGESKPSPAGDLHFPSPVSSPVCASLRHEHPQQCRDGDTIRSYLWDAFVLPSFR